MAIIRCTKGADGNLVPWTIEFEQGDVIEVDSDDSGDPSTLMEVQGGFTLAAMAQHLEQLTIPVDPSNIVAMPVRNKRPDPKLPAPPPEDGAVIFKPANGTCKSIRIAIDNAS